MITAAARSAKKVRFLPAQIVGALIDHFVGRPQRYVEAGQLPADVWTFFDTVSLHDGTPRTPEFPA